METENTEIYLKNDDNLQNTEVRDSLKDESKDEISNERAINPEDVPLNNIQAIKEFAGIAYPTLLFYACLIMQQSILLSYVTKEYDLESQDDVINGVGISNMYMNCTLVSIVIGMIAGFNVLAGNAFGQKKYHLFGIYFHRALMNCYLVCFFIILIHIFTMQYGFKLLGAKDQSLEYALEYCKVSMYFTLFEILFNISYRYLNIARKGYITILVLIITTALHPFWCWLFISKLGYKIKGGAISIILSQCLTGSSLFLFIIIKKPIEGTIFWFTKNSFKAWGSFLKIAIPSALLICLEWWAFEVQQIIVINSGRADWDEQLSVQILSANIFSLLYSVSIGFAVSTSLTTSKYIAQGKIADFKKSGFLSLAMSAGTMLLFQFVIFLAKDSVYKFYTDKQKIIDLGEPVLPFVLLTVFLQNIKSVLQGILIGMRKQIFASIIAFSSYYIIMISLSILFVIHLDWQVKGVWIAESIGYLFINVVYIIYIFFINIQEVVEYTQEKVRKDQEALGMLLDESENASQLSIEQNS